jgi:tetratricopeptide (TPR) repeat protein
LLIREKLLGEEHLDTASSYNDLALVYNSQNRYEEAEFLSKKALKLREKMLGKEHPSTAITYWRFGLFYKDQEQFVIAKDYLEKAIEVFTAKLGEQHPNKIKVEQDLEIVISMLNVKSKKL